MSNERYLGTTIDNPPIPFTGDRLRTRRERAEDARDSGHEMPLTLAQELLLGGIALTALHVDGGEE